jgi:hypothetical protein
MTTEFDSLLRSGGRVYLVRDQLGVRRVPHTERLSYPRPRLRALLGGGAVLCGTFWLYGLAWNEPPLPKLMVYGLGAAACACAFFLRALTPMGTAKRRLETLDAAGQDRLRQINRRSYAPLSVMALSIGVLVLVPGARGLLSPFWYGMIVLCSACALLGAAAYSYSLRLAERRLYAEQP